MVTEIPNRQQARSPIPVKHSPQYDRGAARVEPVPAPAIAPKSGGIAAIAEQLGMSVTEVVAAVEAGESLRDLYLQRGIAPIPGTISDVFA